MIAEGELAACSTLAWYTAHEIQSVLSNCCFSMAFATELSLSYSLIAACSRVSRFVGFNGQLMAGAVNCLVFSVPRGAVVYLVGRGATDLIEDTD